MSKCPCRKDTDPYNLLTCLAPPAGEYETTIQLGENLRLVINNTGLYIRRISADEFLPYINTYDKKIYKETLKAYNITQEKIKTLICNNIQNLQNAALHGSTKAKDLLDACNQLIKEIKEKYCK
ncbi:MAG: hypothetical protein GSR72_07585 [Desulfurococcales archaeon]|nr:hypothetical protein [Desulfurococcales archaeon]MEB3789733.1 hypothetical protein [Desulfurococcales archaeon]